MSRIGGAWWCTWITGIGALVTLLLVTLLPLPGALAADGVASAGLAPVLQSLYDSPEIPPHGSILVDIPELVEDGANVPVTASANVPGATALGLFVESNPRPLAAQIRFPGAATYVRTRLKLADASNVYAIVAAGEHRFSGKAHTRVSLGAGGCSIAQIPGRTKGAANFGKIRMRVRRNGGRNELAILIKHPMETGLRKHPETKATLAAHYIQELRVLRNGVVAVQARLGAAISTDPLFVFSLPAVRDGDEIEVSWRDNEGESGSARLRVAL